MSFDDVLYTGLSYQLSSASTHSLPSRIDQLSDSENDFEIDLEDDSSSALDPYDHDSPLPTRLQNTVCPTVIGNNAANAGHPPHASTAANRQNIKAAHSISW